MRWSVLASIASLSVCGGCRSQVVTAGGAEPLAGFRYAKGVGVSRLGPCTLVTVRPGGWGPSVTHYWLAPRGSTCPPGFSDATTIETPVRSYALETWTGLASVVEDLGLHGGLVAVSGFGDIFPQYRELSRLRQKGAIQQVGAGVTINRELLTVLHPQLVVGMYYEHGSLEAVRRAGIQSIAFAMDQEPTVLGRAEWMRLLAMLFDREEEGNRLFERIRTRYEALAALARQTQAVDVLPARSSGDAWFRYGFEPPLIHDAGGRMVQPPRITDGSFPYEYILEQGATAAVWPFASPRWTSLQDALAADPRLGAFEAVRSGRVYRNNAARLPGYSNPYYTAVYVRPDEVLADFVRMLHPELLPQHRLKFFAKLQ
jgi:iron complex transport system substrate-binding protein